MGLLTNATVLVTGAGGFLGRHAIGALEAEGAYVVPSYRNGHDLRYEADALEAVLLAKPDIVVNVAGVSECASPGSAFKSMLAMGMNVLHAAAVARARVIQVHRAAPDHCLYEEIRRTLVGFSNAYYAQYGTEVTHLVFPEVYGPSDRFDRGLLRVVPHSLVALSEAKNNEKPKATLAGEKDFSMPLLYIDDAMAAIVKTCVKQTPPFGVDVIGVPTSLEKLGKVCAAELGYAGVVEWNGHLHRENAPSRGADAKEVLDWKPSVSLEAGIQKTAEWFLKHLSPKIAPLHSLTPKGVRA